MGMLFYLKAWLQDKTSRHIIKDASPNRFFQMKSFYYVKHLTSSLVEVVQRIFSVLSV